MDVLDYTIPNRLRNYFWQYFNGEAVDVTNQRVVSITDGAGVYTGIPDSGFVVTLSENGDVYEVVSPGGRASPYDPPPEVTGDVHGKVPEAPYTTPPVLVGRRKLSSYDPTPEVTGDVHGKVPEAPYTTPPESDETETKPSLRKTIGLGGIGGGVGNGAAPKKKRCGWICILIIAATGYYIYKKSK